MRKSRRLRATVAGLTLGLLSTVALTGTANAAPVPFELCNYGTKYKAEVEFAGLDMLNELTRPVPPNSCATYRVATNGFHLRYTEDGTGRYRNTALLPVKGGKTLVQTWGTFTSAYPVVFHYA